MHCILYLNNRQIKLPVILLFYLLTATFQRVKILLKGTTERGPLRPSCTCTRGQGPWTHLGDIASLAEKTTFASFVGVTESLWASGPRKPGKTPGGERAFPLGFFQAFPGCFASGMASSTPGQKPILFSNKIGKEDRRSYTNLKLKIHQKSIVCK